MTNQTPDFARSLQELEASDWGDPQPDDTLMVKTLHAIRRKPVNALTDGELRLAVSQRVGEPFVVLVAIDRLDREPLLDGDCYPGDLLSALIRQTSQSVWDSYPQLKPRLAAIYRRALAEAEQETASFRESLGLPTGNSLQ